MSTQNALTTLDPNEYGAIEAAVMETARGRWFLAEFARRNRHSDTLQVLSALERLEKTVANSQAVEQLEKICGDLSEMAAVIERTKSEVAALKVEGDGIKQFEEATTALDAVVRTTEKATSDILEAAEGIQEAAWTLRELNADTDQCDIIDRRATDIYTACTFQDLTAQRTKKVVQTLTYLESRIVAMIDMWKGASGLVAKPVTAAPPSIFEDESLDQAHVDAVVDDVDAFAMAIPSLEPDEGTPWAEVPPAPPAPQTLADDAGAAGDLELPVHAARLDAEPDEADFTLDFVPVEDPLADLPADDHDDDDLVFIERGEEADGTSVGTLADVDALDPRERLRRFT